MAPRHSPSSSPSESDSDREPNSRGARVFWGNLKTPERSRSAFVDPPQTVVRTQTTSQTQTQPRSFRLAISRRFSESHHNSSLEEPEDADQTLDLGCMDVPMISEMEPNRRGAKHLHPSSDEYDATREAALLQETSASGPDLQYLATSKAVSPSTGSETEIEEASVLQPSSPCDILSPPLVTTHLEILEASDHQPLERHALVALANYSVPLGETRSPRTSNLPDLISFDTSTPPRSIPPDSQLFPPPPKQLSSSSCLTVDDLLLLSPVHSESNPRLFSASPHSRVSERSLEGVAQEPAATQQSHPPFPSEVIALGADALPPEVTIPSLGADAHAFPMLRAAEISSQFDTAKISHPPIIEERPVSAGSEALQTETHTPQSLPISLPPSSKGETRKRSPAKGFKGKEKAHDGNGSSGELSIDTSGESLGLSGNGDNGALDKAAKKERRAKARREAEYRRQQLLSLSPASAGVLSLLASPSRDGLTMPFPPIGNDGAISDLATNLDMSESIYLEPATPRNVAARRVPVLASPQRRESSPLRFIQPVPVVLEDPNRTPARRVPTTLHRQAQPCVLPLDDPSRTPARRVAIAPSPTRQTELTELSAPQTQVEEIFPTNRISVSPTKPLSNYKLLKSENDIGLSPSTPSSATNPITRSLPFPIRQTTPGVTNGEISSVPNSRPADPASTKPHVISKLRQPSSVPTSKIARVAAKPYSRPPQALSRLPIASSLRRPGPTVGVGHATNGSGYKPPLSSAALAPSRIPSPIKRLAPPVEPPADASVIPSSPSPVDITIGEDKARVRTTYKRKRQRMISEDDSDEPPAKRPVVVVRPVIKGMYNKAASINCQATDTLKQQASAGPVPLPRPPGPIQIQPVIPGTLRYFETTRSSSRDLPQGIEEDDATDVRSGEPKSPVEITGLSPFSHAPREEAPLVNTDTASTVTTLSREPTLENLVASSSAPRSDTPILTDSGPELRRTGRVRKPYGPDALAPPDTCAATPRRDPMSITRTATLVQRGGGLSSKATTRSSTRPLAPLGGLPANPRQLQALTDANTVRNQAYLADLQTKVVRRYGLRPASPTTKVRTIMEKSKEERSKEREARAERRRRRDEGSSMTASSEGDYIDIPSSPMPDGEASESEFLTKHARGPGDEEDYETPLRHPTTSRVDPRKVAKAVKWDRGLARTISEWTSEQVADEAREVSKVEAIRKGCLARDPAVLHLDPLGNVPDAHVPLEDFEHERVIVTRFVYDDDIEVARTAKKKKF